MYWNEPLADPAAIALWLTLTWDVLKSDYGNIKILDFKGLTLTWDVLKCHSIKYAHLSHSD